LVWIAWLPGREGHRRRRRDTEDRGSEGAEIVPVAQRSNWIHRLSARPDMIAGAQAVFKRRARTLPFRAPKSGAQPHTFHGPGTRPVGLSPVTPHPTAAVPPTLNC